MEQKFATTNIPRLHEVQAAYDELSECFRRDLYITREELSRRR